MSEWTNSIQLFLSISADKLLAITAYGEARGEGAEGMMGVLNVIRNRSLNAGKFGDPEILTITGNPYHAVILKRKQFSMYNPGDAVRAIAEKIALNWNEEIQNNSALQVAHNLAMMVIEGTLADNTGGADHYYNPNVANPSWASTMPTTTQIGNHVFKASSAIGRVFDSIVSSVTGIFRPEPEPSEPINEAEGEAVSWFDQASENITDIIVPESYTEYKPQVRWATRNVTPVIIIGMIVGFAWYITSGKRR